MRKLVLFIAMSADGYIASTDGDLSFLSVVESKGEDYGYSNFVAGVDTVIMGRKTYEKVLSFGIEFPHKNKRCIVVSDSKSGKDENVEFFSGNLNALINELKNTGKGDIYCDGGASLVFSLMKENLIDSFIVSIIPVMLGEGIRLFESGRPFMNLELEYAKSYPSGLVQLCYNRKN